MPVCVCDMLTCVPYECKRVCMWFLCMSVCRLCPALCAQYTYKSHHLHDDDDDDEDADLCYRDY